MSGSIRLDERHGVNPGLENCFFCNEPKGVILYGKIGNRMKEALWKAGAQSVGGEAPRGVILDQEPCSKCKEWMEKGIIFISVDEERSEDLQNPYRTGGWVVMSEDWVKRTFEPGELIDTVLKKRVAFMPDDAWDALGLPRGGEEQADASS